MHMQANLSTGIAMSQAPPQPNKVEKELSPIATTNLSSSASSESLISPRGTSPDTEPCAGCCISDRSSLEHMGQVVVQSTASSPDAMTEFRCPPPMLTPPTHSSSATQAKPMPIPACKGMKLPPRRRTFRHSQAPAAPGVAVPAACAPLPAGASAAAAAPTSHAAALPAAADCAVDEGLVPVLYFAMFFATLTQQAATDTTAPAPPQPGFGSPVDGDGLGDTCGAVAVNQAPAAAAAAVTIGAAVTPQKVPTAAPALSRPTTQQQQQRADLQASRAAAHSVVPGWPSPNAAAADAWCEGEVRAPSGTGEPDEGRFFRASMPLADLLRIPRADRAASSASGTESGTPGTPTYTLVPFTQMDGGGGALCMPFNAETAAHEHAGAPGAAARHTADTRRSDSGMPLGLTAGQAQQQQQLAPYLRQSMTLDELMALSHYRNDQDASRQASQGLVLDDGRGSLLNTWDRSSHSGSSHAMFVRPSFTAFDDGFASAWPEPEP